MSRKRLPNRRHAETFNFEVASLCYTATIGRFADGGLAEIFLTNCKSGSQADSNARDAAVVCSIALQHGVPVETIRHALMRDARGRATGPLGVALDMLLNEEPGPQPRTAQELLFQAGIRLLNYGLGQHASTCPRCSAQRQPGHQKLKCLSVKIDERGATWQCHHCGWSGPEKGNGGGNGHDRDRHAATYDYVDADGALRFQKVRNPPGSANRFWMRRPNGHGGWVNNTKGVDTSLIYRVVEVNEAIALEHTVLVVEGEKDAGNLWRIGVPATCNAHGAHQPHQKPKWTKKHSQQLRGADIVVIPDHDPAGYAHAEVTCRTSLGIAKSVRLLVLAEHWPECPEGGDVSDWLAAGHTREELDQLIAQAPPWRAPSPSKSNEAPATHPDLPDEKGPWHFQCLMSEHGEPLSILANALLALRHEPALKDLFAYDEMQRTPMLMHPLQPDPAFKPRPLTDVDVGLVQEQLQRLAFRRLSKDTTHQAVDVRAQECSYHPVRDYLTSIKWDNVPRLKTWLMRYFGTASGPYVETIGSMFLIAMVARIFNPGCQADYMLSRPRPMNTVIAAFVDVRTPGEPTRELCGSLGDKDRRTDAFRPEYAPSLGLSQSEWPH